MENSNKIPSITSSEVSNWEKIFTQNVTPMVQFDTLDNGKSMKFYNGQSGIEGEWSGVIKLEAEDNIKWNFSIQNGPYIESKTVLNETVVGLFGKIYNIFEEWKEQWSKTITTKNPSSSIDSTVSNPQAPGTVAGGQIPEPTEGPKMMPESNNRQNKISESYDRMRKLAGINFV